MIAVPSSVLQLCSALHQLGQGTWLELEAGIKCSQPLDEESVTSYNLMRLATAVPGVVLEKHNKHREARTGADWEIWVGRRGALIGLRVQAKILKVRDIAYSSQYTSNRAATTQVDKLITSAETALKRLYPVYAFYNYWGAFRPSSFSQACPRVVSDRSLFGWTLASAYAIRGKLLRRPSKRFYDLQPLQLPVSCLFCCNGACRNEFAQASTSLAARVRDRIRSEWHEGEADQPGPIVHKVGPPYVERLLKGERLNETGPRWARKELDERALPRGVSRLLLVPDQVERES
jgi:hypothetical protein